VSGARATVFGLDVRSQVPLSFLEGSSAPPTGRELDIDAAQAACDWPAGSQLICDERQPDGRPIFSIESHPQAGYRIRGPQYGTHLLSADGRRVRCLTESLPDQAWQRLLIAQVLPFAALLHGLEVFHASAVVWRGKAIAVLGRSRAGKTTLALELCRRGASFLADDVLALERGSDGLIGHPGTPVAGVDRAGQPQPLDADISSLGGQVIAVNRRERIVRVRGAAQPAPLTALFLLDRRLDGPARPRFEPFSDPKTLLASTFNFVLGAPERLCGLLDVCALLARLRVERVLAGPAASARELGAAVEQRLSVLA
jgi:hypothetical protein